MSWLRPVTRLTFTPDASSSSYRVTVGPTVMPESRASTPNSASVASSTLPPSSTKRRSISCFAAALEHGWRAAASTEPGRYPGPRSIATCPPASTVVRDRRRGVGELVGRLRLGLELGSSTGSRLVPRPARRRPRPPRRSSASSRAPPAARPRGVAELEQLDSSVAATRARAAAAIASNTRRIGTPGREQRARAARCRRG